MRSSLFALLSLVSLVLAAPVPDDTPQLESRNCNSIPNDPDMGIAQQIYDICMSRGVNDKVLLATFETAWVESHIHVLPCGDQDSVGLYQQRVSQGWGNRGELMDVSYSTNAFLDRAIDSDKQHSWYTAGELAQSVQQSEFPDRYQQNQGKAQSIINQLQPNDGIANVATGGSKSSSKGKSKCSGLHGWKHASVYTKGKKVVHNNVEYQAQWWTKGQEPGSKKIKYNPWKKLGHC